MAKTQKATKAKSSKVNSNGSNSSSKASTQGGMQFKENIGNLDKLVRIFTAVIMAVLVMLEWVTGWQAILLVVIATKFILTAGVGVSILYTLLGINTIGSDK